MILHIIQYEKFTSDYINKINELYDSNDHLFFVHGNSGIDNIRKVNGSNVVLSRTYSGKKKECAALKQYINKADKVILHSIFFPSYLFVTVISQVKKNANKYFWVIWGADLYDAYWKRNDSIGLKFKEILRRYFIRNIRAVGYIPGDYKFLKTHYRTSAQFYLASYTYDFIDLKDSNDAHKSVNIMLGNSASPSCQYLEALDLIKPYKDLDINVWCVLSYPKENQEYINSVIEKGKKIFGDKFHPMTDYLAYDDYMEFLLSIDIAILNNNRQQGLGNIAGLLYYGKRVYLNPLNSCRQYFEDFCCKVFSTEDLSIDDIAVKDNKELKSQNQKAILKFFSDAEFKKRWERIFSADWSKF